MDTTKYSRELALLAQRVPPAKRGEFMMLAQKMTSISALEKSPAYKKLIGAK